MASKSFKSVPTPTRATPTSEQIETFVNRAAPAPIAATPAAKEQTARLSLDLPAELHARFKSACARARLKMTGEILDFIERRTSELER